MALGTRAGLFFGGVYTIGFGQVALRGRSVGSALADGVAGTLKNVLPIGLLAVVAFVGFFAFALDAMLVILLLATIGGLVHPVLAVLLVAPAYFGRSEETPYELQSLMRNSYAVFCLNKKNIFIFLHCL